MFLLGPVLLLSQDSDLFGEMEMEVSLNLFSRKH